MSELISGSELAYVRMPTRLRQETNSPTPNGQLAYVGELTIKVLANEDTLLRTHCCRHKCFPVFPRAQHLLRTQILCLGHKNVSDFVQKHFVSATYVSQFARARKRHEQQCFRNNVSSFATAFRRRRVGVGEFARRRVDRIPFWKCFPRKLLPCPRSVLFYFAVRTSCCVSECDEKG